MKQILVIGGKLAAICAFAAIVLGFVNSVTEPVIAENKKDELAGALGEIAGGKDVGERTDVPDIPAIEYYYPIEEGREGYIVKLIGTGYGGDMHMMAGYEPDGEVFSVEMMENQETPGLGKKAEDPEYMEKFIGMGGEGPVPTSREELPGDAADSVSGATITFVGVGKALQEGSRFVKSLGE
jgi:electron transport complex protein RnfG